MKTTRRNAKRVITAAKRRKLDCELRSVEEHGRQHNVRQQFQSIKNIRQSYQPRVNMIKSKDGVVLTESSSVKSRWIEYYSKLLNRPPPDVPLVGGYDQGLPGEKEGPSAQEVQAAMQSMKKNKAPGMDEVQIEIFNAAGEETKNWITTTVMQTVWEEERMPAEWRDGELVSIHKKGQHLICENYRGLCTLSVGYKIFASILQRRLAPYFSAEVGDYQVGFKRGQSTVDQLFIMRQLLDKNYEYDRDSWHEFIDFKQAYNSVSRESLWVINDGVKYTCQTDKIV